MIDLKIFRENPSIYIKAAKDKGVSVDFDRFQVLNEKLLQLKQTVDAMNAEKNQLTKAIQDAQKSGGEFQSLVAKVHELKTKTSEVEAEYASVEAEHRSLYLMIPNPTFDDVPFGKSDADNVEVEKVGVIKDFGFTPKTHWELLESRGLLDQERSSNVSGSRFYYIRGDLVFLEQALINYALQKLAKKGFEPTVGPNLVREDAMIATGFFPVDKNNIYSVNPGEDDLYLIGTSEVTMVAQHANEMISKDKLPLRYVGLSPCYRREAGTYGKDMKGMVRVHQFTKVEMVSFVMPEDSLKEHELILSVEEEIYQELGIPYRKLSICTGDLGAPAAKKYDLEAWMPGLGQYKEVTSCSNCTDFQARRAQIRYKDNDGNKGFLHTLNGTVIATTRFMAVFVENYQQADGSIAIPEILQPFMMGKKSI